MNRPRKRVVIVDDSRTMRVALEQIFALRMGLDVVGLASDVTSAITLIRSLQPDLVSIDLCMPYLDGCKLLEALDDVPGLRKIVVSGYASDNLSVVAKLEKAGADACFDKRAISLDPAAFCAQVQAVLAKPATRKSPAENPVAAAVAAPAGRVPAYPVPVDENARLEALRRSDLANDEEDAQLDLLTAHMVVSTDFPTCLLTFIDRERQWVKSAAGFDRGSMPRALAFCNYTLCGDETFMVRDAAADPRFAANPLVTDDPRIRSYVGCPIVVGNGLRIGALCLIDTKPRLVTPRLVASLNSLTRVAAEIIAPRLGVGTAARDAGPAPVVLARCA